MTLKQYTVMGIGAFIMVAAVALLVVWMWSFLLALKWQHATQTDFWSG